MWIVYEILIAMFQIKEIRFCWCIHVATEVHGEILNIIASLDGAVHEYTNPVIDLSSMWSINFSVLI